MALITCPECGKEFSDKAPACPECGCPISEAINAYRDLSEIFKQQPITQKTTAINEYVTKCNNCGGTFSYTERDLKASIRETGRFKTAALATTLNYLAGDTLATLSTDAEMVDASNRIIDYTKCPFCGSNNIKDVKVPIKHRLFKFGVSLVGLWGLFFVVIDRFFKFKSNFFLWCAFFICGMDFCWTKYKYKNQKSALPSIIIIIAMIIIMINK